jgi:outer membrane protein assembly factor BamD
MLKLFIRLVLLGTALLVLTGCGFGRSVDATETLPVAEMYAEANRSMRAGNYERAARYYRRLIARFPIGSYTEQAELELGYALFKNRAYEEALSQVNRFIRQYPTHRHIDYAFYLRGLINFEREAGLLERFVKSDATRRDQGFARQSFQDFGELLQRFPDSRFADDARQRMVHLRNDLAQSELNVAGYYFRRRAYVAALSRAGTIVEIYQETPQAAEALAIMAESHARLGHDQLAADTRAVLELNFPDHPYLRGAWPAEGNRLWKLVPFIGESRARGG